MHSQSAKQRFFFSNVDIATLAVSIDALVPIVPGSLSITFENSNMGHAFFVVPPSATFHEEIIGGRLKGS